MALRRGVQSGLMALSHSEAGLARSDFGLDVFPSSPRRLSDSNRSDPSSTAQKNSTTDRAAWTDLTLVQSCRRVQLHDPFDIVTVAREFHATTAKRMGGHGYEEPHYVHAKHMYNLDRMSHRPLKMTLAVLSGFSVGVGVPLFAFYFQQKKTGSQ